MALPDPTVDPDLLLAEIILDVDSQAGELERMSAYFKARGLDHAPLAAAVHYRVMASTVTVHDRLENNRHGLSKPDYLAAHTVVAMLRGFAYGLEYARRTP